MWDGADVYIGKVSLVLEVGDELQARTGMSYKGYYKEGDLGVVSSVSEDKYSITWKSSGETSTISKDGWVHKFEHTDRSYRKKLELGFEVSVLAGNSMEGIYKEGDRGVVSGLTDDTYW